MAPAPQSEIVAELVMGNVVSQGVVLDFLARRGIIDMDELISHLDASVANFEAAGAAGARGLRHLAAVCRDLRQGRPPRSVQ